MKKTRLWPIPVGLLVVFALLCTACGSIRQAAQQQQLSNDLKQLGIAYQNYCASNPTKGPTKAEDLLPYVENNMALVQKTNGEFTFIWGVNLNDNKQFEKAGKARNRSGLRGGAPFLAVLWCFVMDRRSN